MSCPDCFKGTAKDSIPTGTTTTLHNKTVYIASPPPSTPPSPSTIIYLPDAFGHTFINNQLLADTYAARTGMRVLLPDVIPGGGMAPVALALMDTARAPVPWHALWGQLTRAVAIVRLLAIAIPFLATARPAAAYPAILAFARAVRAELPPAGKLGACGFCWGGWASTALCVEAAAPGSDERLLDAQFCAHPSALETPAAIVDAVSRFHVPYALAAAEHDHRLSMRKVDEVEAALRVAVGAGEGENGCYYEVVRYEGCTHGFAVRAGPENEVEMEAAGKACDQAVEWFKKWL
jgi:dienelactone hydrolase